MKVACIQPQVLANATEAAEHALELCCKAKAEGAEFLALPEYCGGLKTEGSHFAPPVYRQEEHPALLMFQDFSRHNRMPMLVGSLAVDSGTQDERFINRSFVLSAEGQITDSYDKLHLFDINLGNDGVFHESATVQPGVKAIVAETSIGRLGLSICYDLRFAALYRKLAQSGAQILTTPAAFSKITGERHWHILNRARAIENTSYVIAPCMTGDVSGGGECYGHSLIIDPWGDVLADAGPEPGICVGDIDLEYVAEVRQKIPSLTHDRPFDIQQVSTGNVYP